MNPIPSHLMSEANIQAEFYYYCFKLELHCALELTTPVGRIDAGIFTPDWKTLLAVVECKRSDKEKRNSRHELQYDRYRLLGVPFFALSNMNRCLPLAEKIKASCTTGREWKKVLASGKSMWLEHKRLERIKELGPAFHEIPAIKLLDRLIHAQKYIQNKQN